MYWHWSQLLSLMGAACVAQQSDHFHRDVVRACEEDQLLPSFWPTSTTVCAFRQPYQCRG